MTSVIATFRRPLFPTRLGRKPDEIEIGIHAEAEAAGHIDLARVGWQLERLDQFWVVEFPIRKGFDG